MLYKKIIPSTLIILTALSIFLIMHDNAYAAQTIDELAQSATDRFSRAYGYTINLICYTAGSGFVISAFFGWYRSQKSQGGMGQSTVASLLIRGLIGVVLLCLPYTIGISSQSIFGTNTSITGEQKQLRFDE